MNRTLFLVGFMASGKSSLGKKISNAFNINHIDLDSFIENQENSSINKIFRENGEAYFRDIEKRYLRQLPLANTIVSTGGGTPMFFNNMEFMKEKGVVLYLVTPVDIIVGRLKQNKEKRPLVADLLDNELRPFVEQKLDQRKEIYAKADILVPHNKSWDLLKKELSFLLN